VQRDQLSAIALQPLLVGPDRPQRLPLDHDAADLFVQLIDAIHTPSIDSGVRLATPTMGGIPLENGWTGTLG
jgi:hypothetical protein